MSGGLGNVVCQVFNLVAVCTVVPADGWCSTSRHQENTKVIYDDTHNLFCQIFGYNSNVCRNQNSTLDPGKIEPFQVVVERDLKVLGISSASMSLIFSHPL